VISAVVGYFKLEQTGIGSEKFVNRCLGALGRKAVIVDHDNAPGS